MSENKESKNGIMALDGIRVLELSIGQTGPVAGAMLGDLGADVIKIEEPTSGDWGRYLQIAGTKEATPPFAYWENNNRNKRSLALNLKKEGAKEIVYRLIRNCDIFLANYRPAALARLGLDYASLSQHNPQIIYASNTGLGRKGPESDSRLADLAAQARGGIMTVTSGSDGSPGRIGAGLADQVGAIFLAYGVLAALLARERTGMGQEVDVSLLGSQVGLGAIMVQLFLFKGDLSLSQNLLAAQDRSTANNPLWNIYRCQNDGWICLSMPATDFVWPEFCRALSLEELEKDPRFDSHENRTAINGRELIAILDRVFATKSNSDWINILKDQVPLMPVGLVQNYADVVNDPQVIENDYVVDFKHPTVGWTKYVGHPVTLSKTPSSIRMPAPELGQHTEDILIEVGGYSWDEIAEMRNHEII